MRKVKASSVPEADIVDLLFSRINSIWEAARSFASRSVNSTHTIASWYTGRQIVEFEQNGAQRGSYGAGILKNVSVRLTAQYGSGFSVSGLQYMRAFYIEYPDFFAIQHALRVKSTAETPGKKQHARSVNSKDFKGTIVRGYNE